MGRQIIYDMCFCILTPSDTYCRHFCFSLLGHGYGLSPKGLCVGRCPHCDGTKHGRTKWKMLRLCDLSWKGSSVVLAGLSGLLPQHVIVKEWSWFWLLFILWPSFWLCGIPSMGPAQGCSVSYDHIAREASPDFKIRWGCLVLDLQPPNPILNENLNKLLSFIRYPVSGVLFKCQKQTDTVCFGLNILCRCPVHFVDFVFYWSIWPPIYNSIHCLFK